MRRPGLVDVLVIAVLGAAIAWIWWRVDQVLVYQWSWRVVPQFLMRFDEASQSWVANLLLQGFAMTLRLAFWASLVAAVLGTVLGLMRVSNDLFFRLVARSYVELIRNVPPLVFIFVFYFFISSQLMPLLGLSQWVRTADPATLEWVWWLFGDPQLLENFASGLICLAMFEAAYVAEIVRAGIESIDRGQWEASGALGLDRRDQLRFVILPQAIERTLPPLASQFISLVKDSSIVSLISIQELTFMAQQAVVASRRVFEIWIVTGLMYFLVCLTLSLLFRRLERRLQAGKSRA